MQYPKADPDKPFIAAREGAGQALTRRRFLGAGAHGAAVLAAGSGLLAACGGTSSSSRGTTAAHPSSTPAAGSSGGQMTVGFIGNGSGETVNPALALVPQDLMRSHQLFDQLWTVSSQISSVDPGLAVSAEATADAKTWTIHLREGVTWHDGTPLSADDLVWTMGLWGKPTSYVYGALAPAIDFKGIRKRGPLTVEVPLLRGIGQLPSLLCQFNCAVIKNGMSLKQVSANPIGTGPYKYVSFTPGQQSVFKGNPEYWGGRPPLDSLIVDSSFAAQPALVNALLGGKVQVVPSVPYLTAKEQASSSEMKLLRAAAPNTSYFSLRVDKPPFNDVRVRQALKLIADRKALVAGALDGFGTAANDLLGADAKYYASDLVRTQDIEQAKSLLKAAGQSDLRVTLQTSSAGAGMQEAATLFAQQAKAAGVTIKLDVLSSNAYYTSAGGWLTRVFGQNSTGTAYASLAEAYILTLWTGAPYNDSHWGSAAGESNTPFFDALSALEPDKAMQLWGEVQKTQFDEGGYLAWGNADFVDAVAPNVRGLQTTPAGSLNNYNFTHASLAA